MTGGMTRKTGTGGFFARAARYTVFASVFFRPREALDDPAVDVFVVAQVQRPERGAELHDRDGGCFGEARHEQNAHVQTPAEW